MFVRKLKRTFCDEMPKQFSIRSLKDGCIIKMCNTYWVKYGDYIHPSGAGTNHPLHVNFTENWTGYKVWLSQVTTVEVP